MQANIRIKSTLVYRYTEAVLFTTINQILQDPGHHNQKHCSVMVTTLRVLLNVPMWQSTKLFPNCLIQDCTTQSMYKHLWPNAKHDFNPPILQNDKLAVTLHQILARYLQYLLYWIEIAILQLSPVKQVPKSLLAHKHNKKQKQNKLTISSFCLFVLNRNSRFYLICRSSQ